MSYLDKFETVEVRYPQGGYYSLSDLPEVAPEWEWRPLDRMKASLQQSVGSLWAAGSAVADSIGLESASEWAANRSGELFEQAFEADLVEIPITEADGVEEYFQWAVNTLTSFVPDLGLMALGGVGLGSVAGKLALQGTGKKLTEQMLRKGLKRNLDDVLKTSGGKISRKQAYTQATRQTAREMGALLGVAGVEGSMQGGEAWLTDLDTRGVDANPWAAMAAGVASSAVTILSPVNRLIATGRLGKNPLTMTIGEAAEELGQESVLMIHEAGISPDTTLSDIVSSEEGITRLIESGAAGALLGGVFGGGSSAIQYKNRRAKRIEEAKNRVIEEPQSALESANIDTSQDATNPLEGTGEQSKVEAFNRADQIASGFEARRKSILERKNKERILAEDTKRIENERLAPQRQAEDAFQSYEPDLPTELQQNIRREELDKRAQEILREKREAQGTQVAQEQQEAAGPVVVEQEGKDPYVRGEVATYNTPEGQRRINAAREIAAVDWDNLDTNDYLPQSTKEGLKSEDPKVKRQAKGEALSALVSNLDAEVKKPTNLRERNKAIEGEKKAASTIKDVQAGKIEMPKTLKVDDVPQDVGPDVTVLEPEVYQAQQEAAKAEDKAAGDAVVPRGPIKDSYNKEGWQTLKTTVDGKDVPLYINENASIMKTGSNSFEVVLKNEDGDPVRYGTFTTKGDAISALEAGKDAETFYKKDEGKKGTISAKTDELYKLNEQEETMYKSLPVQKIIDRALKPLGLEGDADARSAINEAILKSIKAVKPKGPSIDKILNTKVAGAVQDIQKKQSVSIDVDMEEGGTIGDQLTKDSKPEPQDTTLSIEKRKTATTKRVELEGEVVDLVKEGKRWYRAEDTERKRPLGTNVKDIITDITEEVKSKRKSSEVKNIKEGEGTVAGQLSPERLKAFKAKKARIEAKKAKKEKEAKDTKDTKGTKEPKEVSSKDPIKDTSKEGDYSTIDTIDDFYKISYSDYKKLSDKEQGNLKSKFLSFVSNMDIEDRPPLPDFIKEDNRRKRAKFNEEEAKKSPEQLRKEWEDDMRTIASFEAPLTEGTGVPHPDFKDAIEALNFAKGSRDKVSKVLAKLLTASPILRNKLKGVPVRQVEGVGSYYKDGVIYLNKETASPMTIVHEAIHSITVRELASNEAFRNQIDKFMRKVEKDLVSKGVLSAKQVAEIKKLKGAVDFADYQLKEGIDQGIGYALRNRKEFLAQAFSSPTFQAYLKGIKFESPVGIGRATLKDLWSLFVNEVRKVLRLDSKHWTALDELISQTMVIAESPLDVVGRDFSEAPVDIEGKEKKDKKPKKTWEDKLKVMEEKTAKGKPGAYLEKAVATLKDSLRDLGKSMTEVLRKVDRRLIRPVRKMEQKIVENNVAYQRRVKPFFNGYQELGREDKLMLDLTLVNYNKEEYKKKADEILKKTGLAKSFEEVRAVLKEIHDKKERVGLNHYNATPDYFPRRVKDIRGLMKAMKDDPTYGVIQATIDSLGKKADDAQKENAIMSMMNTGKMPSLAFLDPTSSKKRSIDTVSSEWAHHYDSSMDALINHIYESNEAIYKREFFGDVNRKNLVKKRDDLIRQLENDKISQKVRETKVGKLQNIEDALDNYEQEFKVGISDFLKDFGADLSAENQDIVVRSIRARLTQKGMHGTWANVRNLSLMASLSSPTSAITQIGDFAFSVYKYGPTNTIKALLGDKIITTKDLDLSHSLKEFQSEGTTRWLDKTLKWSGLQFMDQVGKTTTMNAALKNAQGMSLEQFRTEYRDILWEDTDQTYQDIKEGKNTELVRFFAFNELSNFQPVSLSEMPVSYLTAGNGRIFYTLKSYNIKAINSIYREFVHKWRTAKNSGDKAKAARGVGRLIFLMTIAGATADELKDLLIGREAGTFSDSTIDSFMQIALLSRYSLDKSWREGDIFGTLFGDILLPPSQYVTAPVKDVASLFTGEPDFTTLKYLPWGKLPYGWFSPKGESKDKKRLKDEVMDEYKKGSSFSSIRSRMNSYNAWARKNDESLLTFSNLNKSRSNYRKENS